jgi:hypothetical protein
MDEDCEAKPMTGTPPTTTSGKPITTGNPGYKTTEFLVTVVVQAFVWIDAIKGSLPDRYAGYASAISAVGYGIARGLAKN